jgi:hypothetical protein
MLVELVEREDEEAVLVDNDIDDSDEVGDPALAEWMHQRRNELYFTTLMIVDIVS